MIYLKKQTGDLFISCSAIIFLIILYFLLFPREVGYSGTNYLLCYSHEPGHFIMGIISGCPNLKINCVDYRGPSTEGFSYECSFPILDSEGNYICNWNMYLTQFSGFFSSFLFFSLIFGIFLKTTKRFYSNSDFKNKILIFWILALIFLLALPARNDFCKIITYCHPFNSILGDIVKCEGFLETVFISLFFLFLVILLYITFKILKGQKRF